METEERLQTAETLLKAWTLEISAPTGNRLDVIVEVADLITAVQTLQETKWGYLAAITGLDSGIEVGTVEVLYHFCSGAAVLTIRVKVNREAAAVPTITNLIPSASFFERELGEMFGITIQDAADSSHLFLPDEWPEGVFPLRKDFQGVA